jgi:hypothetical protein
MLSPCPTGWKSEPDESVDLILAAVRCGVFPLYEVFDGERFRINAYPDAGPPQAGSAWANREGASDLATSGAGDQRLPGHAETAGLGHEPRMAKASALIEAYVAKQRRYASALIDPQRIAAAIERQWRYLDAMARLFPATPED